MIKNGNSLTDIGVCFGQVSVLIMVVVLSACGFFRNREFDYTRQTVKQRPAINIPKSVSKKPVIQPYFELPSNGPNAYEPEPVEKAEKALMPPLYEADYHPEFIKKQQTSKAVDSRLAYNDQGEGVINIETDFDHAWELVDEALNSMTGFVLDDKNRSQRVFYVSDRFTSKDFDVYITPDKQDDLSSVSVFSDGKIAADNMAHSLLEQIQSKIEQETQTEIDIGKVPSQITKNADNNSSILVIYEAKSKAWKLIQSALDDSSYKILSDDSQHSFKIARKITGQSVGSSDVYILKVDEQTFTGLPFSDISNISSGFRKITKQTQVEIFDQKDQLLTVSESQRILSQLQNHL